MTFAETVTLADLMQVVAQTRSIEAELERCPDRVIDFTGATAIGFGYAELSALSSQRVSERPRNRYSIVFVADSEVGYGISRMYQALGEHAEITVLRAKTVAEAMLALDA